MEEDGLTMIIGTSSTAMTHHRTTGPLYHHYLSDDLDWSSQWQTSGSWGTEEE